jgi:hypothetical protein
MPGASLPSTTPHLQIVEALEMLVTNTKTLNYHAANLPIMSFPEDTPISSVAEQVPSEARIDGSAILRDAYIDSVKDAYNSYKRQMIVLIVAYLEGLITDFLWCIFVAHPSRMYDYLADGTEKSSKGKIDLKDVIDSESKDVLIDRLATRAASNVMKGRFDATLNSLQKVTRLDLNDPLRNALCALNEQRNRIVHEASPEIVASQQVRKNLEYLEKMLVYLGQAALSNQVEVIDPTNLVMSDA